MLAPMWQTKRTTAERLRGRIERVLDAAKARGLTPSPYANPARWRGHLDHILPKRRRLERRITPRCLMPRCRHSCASCGAQRGIAARALEFAILTAARSGEVLGARWSEIDLDEKALDGAGERMKSGRTHRVPLSRAALAILKPLHEARASEFVFPGAARPARPHGDAKAAGAA